MDRVDRKDLYAKINNKYGRGRTKLIDLVDRVMDHCEEWADGKNVGEMDPKHIHDSLKKTIMQEEKKHGAGGAFGFLPAFVWMFLLGQLISFVIKWWLEKNGYI